MTERGESREDQQIALARINSSGEIEYTQPVIDAFEAMLERQKNYPSIGEVTMSDPQHLFAAEYKMRGHDKFWERSYYRPHISDNPKEPIVFKPNLHMTLHQGNMISGIRANYYPEDNSFYSQKIDVGIRGPRTMAEVDLTLSDRLSVDWVVDGVVGRVIVEDKYKQRGQSDTHAGILGREKLDPLYKGQIDRVSVPIGSDPDSHIEAALDDYYGHLVVRRTGGHPSAEYQIPSRMTPLERDEIVAKMASQELLENPGTAPITEDIWKGLDLLSTFGIKVLPSQQR